MRKLRQWTLNHPLQFVSVFMLVYFTWFSLLEKYAQPVLMIHSKLDDKIPFCEYFIVPYLLWFVWIAGTFVYFYIKSRDDFYHALPLKLQTHPVQIFCSFFSASVIVRISYPVLVTSTVFS